MSEESLRFVALGAGNEVGRSCHILEFKNKSIMLDAGVHPAYSGLASLPFYDEYDLSQVDVLLISHFHVDHAASLPYVLTKTSFKGRVIMTHPTKAILQWLLADFVRISGSNKDMDPDTEDEDLSLYDESDLAQCMQKVECVDYHSTIEIEGIKITPYYAGHVLGAAMFMIEIANLKVLFTGDYSREIDRHLHAAEVPPRQPDVLICESTYGTALHESRLEREARLTNLVRQTVQNGGRVLMPQFALGNTQELLLMLDEFWHNHPELHHIPIYYASNLARKCMAIYQTYTNVMNSELQQMAKARNPFLFRHISNLRNIDNFQDIGPAVVIATPGMLQNGISRSLLERWCPDPKNALILTGYSVEGTMAKLVTNAPPEIVALNGHKIPRRMAVEEISFAAHVDYHQNRDFIDLLGPPKHIILVHGERNIMGRLKSALLSMYHTRSSSDTENTPQTTIYNPKNCDWVDIMFKSEKIAKVVGTLAGDGLPSQGTLINSLLIQNSFQYKLMSVENLGDLTDLATSRVRQRQSVSYGSGYELLKYHLQQMFGTINEVDEGLGSDKDLEIISDEDSEPDSLPSSDKKVLVDDMKSVKRIKIDKKTKNPSMEIQGERKITVLNGVIEIIFKPGLSRVYVLWNSGDMSDTLADAVIAVILSIESSPVSVKLSGNQKCESAPKAKKNLNATNTLEKKMEKILQIIKSHFGSALKTDNDTITIDLDKHRCVLNMEKLEFEGEFEPLKARANHVLHRALLATAPFF